MTAPDRLREGPTVAELQRSIFGAHPERQAISSPRETMTYGQLDSAINRTARLFLASGLKQGDGLAILSSNRIEVVLANWAAQRLGLRYTPLHPRGSLSDHLYILDHAQISALVVDDVVFGERGREIAAATSLPALFSMEGSIGTGLEAASRGISHDPCWDVTREDDLCNIFFTGGTTGLPKGAAHTNRSIAAMTLLSLATWDWPRDIRFLLAAPVSHAGGAMLMPTLMRGGSFHMVERFRPEEFLREIEEKRITATFLVPTMLYDLLDCPALDRFDLSSLEMVIYGAAPMSPTRLAEAIRRIGPVFCQLYGQTEAPNLVTYLSRRDHDPDNTERLSSCGRPVPGVGVAILSESGTVCAPGQVGEIAVRGPLVMQGYWRDPEQTAETMRDGWLRTGDLAVADNEGFLTIVDRAKDLIISGGFNVYSREVEDCLVTHPGVRAAAVVGLPHERWGELVAAFIVVGEGPRPEPSHLVEHVKARKGDVYAPKVIEFVEVLPVTAVGKIDKKAIRQAYWKGHSRSVS